MRRFSATIPALVTGVCLYFVFAFGRDALTVFTSPIWGLENSDFARAVHGFGRWFGLPPAGLVQLAAFFGALKLAVATAFALHLIDRLHPRRTNPINHELLDAAALLAVVTAFILAIPAMLENAPQLIAPHRPALWLAGLAATLNMIERIAETQNVVPAEAAVPVAAMPPRRNAVSTLRWDALRRQARGL